MKTNNNTPKTQNTASNNVATAAASAISSAVGATAGIVAAELLTPTKAAAQPLQSPVVGNHQRPEEPLVNSQPHAIPNKPIAHSCQEDALDYEPEQTDNLLVDPADPEVVVVEYDTLQDEYGQQMDMAVVEVEGQEIGFLDMDQDGIADLAVMDVNGDGTITEDEVQNVTECSISMDQMHNDFLAQNDPTLDGPDYINDGNVESYMA